LSLSVYSLNTKGDFMLKIDAIAKYLWVFTGLFFLAGFFSGCATPSYKSATPEFKKFCEEYAASKCGSAGTAWQSKQKYGREYEKLQTEASCWLHYYQECLENPEQQENFKPSSP